MKKFIVCFDPTEESWTNGQYREFLKDISIDEDSELKIVSLAIDAILLESIKKFLTIEDKDVHIVADNDAVVAKIIELKPYLYLAPDIKIVERVNNEAPIILEKGKDITGTKAILLNNIFDNNKLQYKYITNVNFWSKEINKYK